MAKRTAGELDAIIRNKMPGFHLSKKSTHSPGPLGADAPVRRERRSVAPGSSTPSIAVLRTKYIGASDASADPTAIETTAEEAEIVTMEPDFGDDERRHAKTVVISPEGKILGAQG